LVLLLIGLDSSGCLLLDKRLTAKEMKKKEEETCQHDWENTGTVQRMRPGFLPWESPSKVGRPWIVYVCKKCLEKREIDL
jgi:hypothetical protein